jgi:hypothetical protein
MLRRNFLKLMAATPLLGAANYLLQTEQELPPGEYTVTCTGVDAKRGVITYSILEKRPIKVQQRIVKNAMEFLPLDSFWT